MLCIVYLLYYVNKHQEKKSNKKINAVKVCCPQLTS